jgi:hypothetical protein
MSLDQLSSEAGQSEGRCTMLLLQNDNELEGKVSRRVSRASANQGGVAEFGRGGLRRIAAHQEQ